MEFTFFDAHCDTLACLADKGGGLKCNTYHVDTQRMKGNMGGYVQFFAAYVSREDFPQAPFERAEELIGIYHREIKRNEDIVECLCEKDAREAIANHKAAAFLSIEGGEAIEGSLEKLRGFYEAGVRMMTLTWNNDNEISGGIGKNTDGLTEFGKTVVEEMNRLGMIIDVSHISEKGFWDVTDLSKKPIVASHSNAKGLCGHRRNLNDNQIKRIIGMDGFIGINFYPLFVKGDSCTIDDIIDHVEYFLELGGENNIGFGSDFDGISALPDGIHGLENIDKLVDCMIKRGFGEKLIKKITSENFFRVIRAVL